MVLVVCMSSDDALFLDRQVTIQEIYGGMVNVKSQV